MQEPDNRVLPDVSTSDVNALLFKSKNTEEPKPFDNIPDLGRVIVALPQSPYPGKEDNVIAFLRQVLNGSRPCPEDLLKAILEATRYRMSQRQLTGNIDSLVARVEKGILTIQQSRGRRMRDNYGVSQKLEQGLLGSDSRFAINPPVGEIYMSLSMNKRISLLVAENLALFEEGGDARVTYKICYPGETDAIDFWRLLFDELIGKFGDAKDSVVLGPETAANRIQQAEDNGNLQIIIVPYYLCLASAVIYHIDDREKCTGAALQMDEKGRVKLYEIREQNIPYWRQMYNDLEKGAFGTYKPLNFAEYRNLVMRKPFVS